MQKNLKVDKKKFLKTQTLQWMIVWH